MATKTTANAEVKITKTERRILEAIADGWRSIQRVDHNGRRNYMTGFGTSDDGTTKVIHTETIRSNTVDSLRAKLLIEVDWPRCLKHGEPLYYVITESGRKLVKTSS